MIIPSVDEFDGNYVGQLLTLREELSEKKSLEAVRDACGELPWPADETVQHEAQLTDRRSDEPLAVRMPVFLDRRKRPEQDDALFIVNRATPCDGSYVRLEVSPIEQRSITLEGSGPTVTEDENSSLTDVAGSGFGFIAGALGAATAGLLRLVHDRG
jgi:hypothetical protein